MQPHQRPRRLVRCLLAFLAGVVTVYAVRYVIDRTQIADRIVRSLVAA